VTDQPHADPVHPPADDPPVKYETHDAHIPTIVFVGCILIACAVIVHVGIWGLFQHWMQRDERTKRSHLPLVEAEMNQLPAQPRLEAYEPNRARVFLQTDDGRTRTFYVDTDITVERVSRTGQKTRLELFDLRPGTEATLTYSEPPSLPGRERVVRIQVGEGRGRAEDRSTETGLLAVSGRIEHVEAKSGPDKRQAAEAELARYGWVDEKEKIAHIPIDEAMKLALERHLLEGSAGKEGGKAPAKKPEAGGEKR
jgi:hypothetical protein